jgi:hypothetical protein
LKGCVNSVRYLTSTAHAKFTCCDKTVSNFRSGGIQTPRILTTRATTIWSDLLCLHAQHKTGSTSPPPLQGCGGGQSFSHTPTVPPQHVAACPCVTSPKISISSSCRRAEYICANAPILYINTSDGKIGTTVHQNRGA